MSRVLLQRLLFQMALASVGFLLAVDDNFDGHVAGQWTNPVARQYEEAALIVQKGVVEKLTPANVVWYAGLLGAPLSVLWAYLTSKKGAGPALGWMAVFATFVWVPAVPVSYVASVLLKHFRDEGLILRFEREISGILDMAYFMSDADVQSLGEMLAKYSLDTDVKILAAFSAAKLKRIILAFHSLRALVGRYENVSEKLQK